MVRQFDADPVERREFNSRLEAVRVELHKVLQQPCSGSIGEALHIGNTVLLALRVVEGQYEVSETSFRLDTMQEQN